jgi:23S rRNA pseudouridine2604 synthase
MIQNNKKEIKNSVRLNLYLAQKNIASRREADELIKGGVVFVNGKQAVLGMKINPTDTVEVKKSKNTKKYVYYAYYKPKGVVTTNKSKGEKEILDVTKFPETVYPVGRLDKESHGLIIMTNDGRIVKKILDPNYQHEKEYEVLLDKAITPSFLTHMKHGVNIGDYTTKPCKITPRGQNGFSIVLTEGKNRQIRRMCEALGYKVIDLKRTRVMTIPLGSLKPKEYRPITLRTSFLNS